MKEKMIIPETDYHEDDSLYTTEDYMRDTDPDYDTTVDYIYNKVRKAKSNS